MRQLYFDFEDSKVKEELLSHTEMFPSRKEKRKINKKRVLVIKPETVIKKV